ncbi:hypothetical protein [uncultured Pseudoteredinibacter sp.]|uniref:hypothetical protein n=1 Tax=uncultured Pseudoteredinibacter sp. TaxID=1641701 RepID=UPI00261E7F19|nr:hypothetical protein [uncultured Pseudoteredinibacter sp.]
MGERILLAGMLMALMSLGSVAANAAEEYVGIGFKRILGEGKSIFGMPERVRI